MSLETPASNAFDDIIMMVFTKNSNFMPTLKISTKLLVIAILVRSAKMNEILLFKTETRAEKHCSCADQKMYCRALSYEDMKQLAPLALYREWLVECPYVINLKYLSFHAC